MLLFFPLCDLVLVLGEKFNLHPDFQEHVCKCNNFARWVLICSACGAALTNYSALVHYVGFLTILAP